MRLYQKDITSKKVILYMVDDSDHVSPETGLTLTVRVSKNGGAFAAGAGSVAELEDGLYAYTFGAGDVDTLGPVVIKATATGADQCVVEGRVVAFDPDDASALGLGRLDAAITSRLAAADVPDHFSSLAITETTGKVTVNNVDECKADVSGLATSAEIAALNDFDPATEKVEIAGTKNRLDDLNDIDGSSVTVTTNNDKTGYALTTGERSSIADAVWAATTRTLSSFGTLVADTAAAVWGAVSRTLTAGTKDSEIAAIYGKLPTGSIADQATAEAVKAQTDKMNFNAESPTKILAEATANAEISSEDIKAMADQVVAGVLDAEEISRLAEGTGSTQYTYTVRDENESPIPDVRVWVYSNSGLTTLIARSATNNFGVCTFYLDPGTYYFVCQKAGYTFNNPDIETVSE
jgi:hypothetical protein